MATDPLIRVSFPTVILALLSLLLLPAESNGPKLKVGDRAPAFSLPGTSGKSVQLSEFKGKKKVVLAFFPKAFSGGCKKEMSGLRDQQAEFDKSGAQILGVSLDDLGTQKKFAEALKLTFPLLSDKEGKTAAAYGVKGAMWANRTTFVVDEGGRISSILEGKDAIDPGVTLLACRAKPTQP